MLFNQKSPVHREAGFLQWHTQTHTHTTSGHRNLETESAQRADSAKIEQTLALCCFFVSQKVRILSEHVSNTVELSITEVTPARLPAIF